MINALLLLGVSLILVSYMMHANQNVQRQVIKIDKDDQPKRTRR